MSFLSPYPMFRQYLGGGSSGGVFKTVTVKCVEFVKFFFTYPTKLISLPTSLLGGESGNGGRKAIKMEGEEKEGNKGRLPC